MAQRMNLAEMDDFLERIDDVHNEIKAMTEGKDTEEFRQKEEGRRIKKEREEATQRRKEKEAYETKCKGRKGKGEKENYLHYCPRCQWEYELSTPTCLRCNKECLTYKERYAILLEKAKEYQDKKIAKKERLKKWELWQKTQSMFYNKMATNYSKWDYFESSEEEEEPVEPILPTDNPEFKALEKDLEERNKKRKADLAEADKFKALGNECLKKGEYELAVEKYSLGLSFTKDNKALYLNRALARMKQNKFTAAIKDCTKVLEIAEFFEEGFTRSKDSNFKAFLRRAQCHKEQSSLHEASHDIAQALLLEPHSKEAQKLQQDIQLKIDFKKKSSEIKQKEREANEGAQPGDAAPSLSAPEQIKAFLALDQPQDKDFLLVTAILERESDLKVFFYEQKGLQRCVEWLSQGVDAYFFLMTFLRDQQVFLERFHKEKGTAVLLDNLCSPSQLALAQSAPQDYLAKGHVGETCELLLTMSQNEYTRGLLQKECHALVNAFLSLHKSLVKHTQVLVSLTSLVGNLVYGCTRYKDIFLTQWSDLVQVSTVLMFSHMKSHRKAILRETYYNFLANLINETEVRAKAVVDQSLVLHLCQSVHSYSTLLLGDHLPQHTATLSALLAVLVNLLFSEQFALPLKHKLPTYLQEVLPLLNQPLVLSRGFQVLAKFPAPQFPIKNGFLEYALPLVTTANAQNNVTQPILRLLIKLLHEPTHKNTMLQLPTTVWPVLMQALSQQMASPDEQLFCNSCNLGGYVLDLLPLNSPQPSLESSLYSAFTSHIPALLKIISDSTGNRRKNAAIFVAKLCRDSTNVQVMRDHHGVEILQSVTHLIVDKKK